MRVFAYAFKAGKWVETPRLSVRDVALLVDTENRVIYIWHGPKSKIKDQNEAKKLLLSLKDRYSSFQFQKVGRSPSPELQAEIKRLLGSRLGKGKTRILAIAGMVAGLVGVGFAIFVIYNLYSEDVGITTVANQISGAFNNWLETLTIFTGIGLIAFGVAAALSLISGRKYMAITLIIGLGMGVLAILYVNWLRPYYGEQVEWNVETFGVFQLLLLVMEVVAFAPFTIGFIIEVIRIMQE
ncbi:hypothetical protein GF325_18380 [Candidatus Bathyarchaeota archaeon]|nr:hypothetical protein [Candidatus Bathyarchaeota archaeon]